MLVRIEGFDLPGRDSGDGDDSASRHNIHVGVQRRNRPRELLDLVPGDASTAVWTLDCTAKAASDGGIDVQGQYVQGSPGGRFIYLSWGTADDGGEFTVFRRAKLMMDGVPTDILEEAARTGLLRGRLGLTDSEGLPICAAVRPPRVEWSAGSGD